MDVILNEYSLNGQFESIEEFVLWIRNEWMEMFDYFLQKKVAIYKKSNFYSNKVTKDETLRDLLKMRGDPLIAKIKSFIINSAYSDPYWDTEDNCKSKQGNTYKCPNDNDLPNCFSEAIERDRTVLSIKNENYLERHIVYLRDNVAGELYNIVEYNSFLIWLLEYETGDDRYVFEHYKFDRQVEFAEVDGRCYAEEALQQNNLTVGDKKKLLLSVSDMIRGLSTGKKNRFWDSISDEIFEYRLSVSAGREFRLLFVQNKKTIVFLNGFIKKQQKTPTYEIDKAKKIKRKYLQC